MCPSCSSAVIASLCSFKTLCYVYGIVINLQDVVSSGQEFLHRQKSVSRELEVCKFSSYHGYTGSKQKLPSYHQKLTVGSNQTLSRNIRKSSIGK